MKDLQGRVVDYMRISITDRCNLRCRYCMPEGIRLIPMEELLTFEEILEVCRQAVVLGIRKFKITGGEPLVRKGCAKLISDMKKLPGVEQVTMTTNGILLKDYLEEPCGVVQKPEAGCAVYRDDAHWSGKILPHGAESGGVFVDSEGVSGSLQR